jgi:hypothetical protein
MKKTSGISYDTCDVTDDMRYAAREVASTPLSLKDLIARRDDLFNRVLAGPQNKNASLSPLQQVGWDANKKLAAEHTQVIYKLACLAVAERLEKVDA